MPATKSKQEHAASAAPDPQMKRLYRLPKSGKIAGVCAGLAEYFEMDVTLLRVLFVILTLASGGFGIILYFVLAIVMPVGDGIVSAHATGKDLGENINNIAAEIRENGGVDRLRNFFGAAIILLGVWLLLLQFFPHWINLNWEFIWPTLLILLGLFIIARSRR